jgi:hypothetical protein
MSYDRCKLCWMPAKQPLMAMEECCSKEGCPGVEKRNAFAELSKKLVPVDDAKWAEIIKQSKQ